MNCIPLDEMRPKFHQMDRSIPLARVKSIITITTPNDANNNSQLYPPFIEFDMSKEGFSCMFIPSIAPVATMGSVSGPTNILTGAIVGNSDVPVTVNGGIGTGERAFPSQSGLSFTTWVYIHSNPDGNYGEHPIRILTLYRSTHPNVDYTCFQIYITPDDKSLTVSTQEMPIFSTTNTKCGLDSEHNIRLPASELFEDKWNHIVVVLNRTLLKNSTINIYVNGKIKHSQKMAYISSVVGGAVGISNTSPIYINGFVGTPPQYRKIANLTWKQGSCHLIEEPLGASFISYIYMLGPSYIGSFQTINYASNNLQSQQQQQQLSEDRVIFGLNSRATSVMTLSKMRRVYSKFDCKQISKIIGISIHENATPIQLLHNSAGHLIGPSRPLGGVLIGNIGVRCFVPKQISLTFSDVGGCCVILGMVANSKNMETLYASVKALVCILRTNKELQLEMERINGYQTLAIFLKRKKPLLNSHILHLIFEMITCLSSKLLQHINRSSYVSLEANTNTAQLSNFRAFKVLLVDSINLWVECDFLSTLIDRFNEILYEAGHHHHHHNSDRTLNINHLREMNLLQRIVYVLKDQTIKSENLLDQVYVLCFRLLNRTNRHKDILFFGQFIASLMVPKPTTNEVKSTEAYEYKVKTRNALLKVVLQLMTRNTSAINATMQEDLARVLGFDWFLLFLRETDNEETVTISFVNLMLILSNTTLHIKFKEIGHTGNWIKDAESFVENQTGTQLLGFNISTLPENSLSEQQANLSNLNELQKHVLTLPGYVHLNLYLSEHVYQPKVYLIIFQTLLGHYRALEAVTLGKIDAFTQLTFESLIQALFDEKQRKNFKQLEIGCKDLVLSVISMVHSICWVAPKQSPQYEEYPKIIISFIKFLYSNNRDFRYFCQNSVELLNALCKALVNNIEGKEEEYIDHPCSRPILDLIMTLLLNTININQGSLTGMNTGSSFFTNPKPIVLFENILEQLSSCKKAQTEVMTWLMNCIHNSLEVMSSPTDASMLKESSTNVILNFNNSFANIIQLMSVVVDRMWQNAYIDDKKKILECLIRILKDDNVENKAQQSNFKSIKNLTFQLSEVAMLHKATNRCVLYLISRSIDTMSDRMFIFEVLQLIYTNKQVIISKANADAEFFICLTHCLLQLIDEESISLSAVAKGGRSTWYVSDSNSSKDKTDEGALLIASVTKKIWEEIYINKKQMLEETLKTSLAPANSNFGLSSLAPDISQLRDQLYDSTLKYWYSYIDAENQRQRRKPTNPLSFDLPNLPNPTSLISEKLTNINKFNNLVTKSAGGLVSKIVGGTSGVVGSALSTAVGSAKKEMFRTNSEAMATSPALWTMVMKHNVLKCHSIQTSIIEDFINYNRKQKQMLDLHLSRYVLSEWLNNEYEYLTREKAIWGPSYGSKRLDKWKLDMTEGPNRMRKKLVHNEEFYTNYPYKPEFETTDARIVKLKSVISLDSKEYYKRILSEKYFLLDKEEEDSQSLEFDLANDISVQVDTTTTTSSNIDNWKNSSQHNKVLRTRSSSDYEDAEQDPNDSFDVAELTNESEMDKQQRSLFKKDDEDSEKQTILRLLEEGEKITYMFRVARIQGLDSYEGLLLFGKEHFYIIDGFTLLKSREIRDVDTLNSRLVV